ncbi:putative E3 ubiquitin-protein ligase HERC1 [Dichanthelium oligosanthes]|uniref:Putative E3 ubiquitin-protein ligase HERC1 n=1 Tax=Dichanthelium oligosanthes TaxID=888268 RepID=A0A1E5VCM5_9POAL|nr:putative E3 ubiquitin-protein ligase HERC1 [Dichanthelium oligosanthes]
MTPDENAVITLKKGSKLIKYSRKGKPKIRTFRLASDETSLIWYSHKREKFLRLSSVSKVIPGQRTAVFRRFLRPEKDYLSFSLIYKNGQRSLDLVCKDQAEVEVWFSTLEGLISLCRKNSVIDENKDRVSFSDEVSYYPDRHSYDATLDIASSISRSFNTAGYCGTNSFSFRRSDAGSDRANMIRTSGADGTRLSISSAPSSSSQGSGTDDIESLGDVYVWGEVWTDVAPSDGQTSSSCSKVDVLIPKPLESDVVLDVNQIVCGSRHVALTTRQGEVFTWGEEFGGRLGHGTDTDISRPKLVESISVTIVDFISCGEFHTCAISASGDLFNWGDGSYHAGLLGYDTGASHWLPKRVSGPLEGLQVLSVACGSWHSALITSSGKLYTFGDGTFGVLGHGNRESVAYPKEVEALNGFRTVKVACGVWHSAAIVESTVQTGMNVVSKKLYTWGNGDKNQLGHGDKEARLIPTSVQALLEHNFHQLACGQNMTVALATTGHVYTMGSAENGQLGNPKSDGKQPCLVKDKLGNELVEEISCGASHVAVLTSRSEVYTWGMGANGRLGHGDVNDKKTPTIVEALKDRHVKSISCGSNFTTCICIHKWVSGADQSVCTGCRQAFGFTRKRHNCYNCGLVHCHACSSRKVLKAALAPTPGKPHRVCDSCFLKLKNVDTNNNNASKRNAPTRRSTDSREKPERPEIRPSKLVPTPSTEPVKYMEVKAAKSDMKTAESIMKASQASALLQFKDLGFAAQFGALQPMGMSPALAISPTIPAFSLAPPSPYTKKTKSPPAAAIPQSSKVDFDNLQKSNELLNQELLKLQSQVDDLKQKCEAQHEQLQKSDKKAKSVASMATEESNKRNAAVDFVKFLDNELKGIVDKLPSDAVDSIKALQVQMQSLLREQSSHPSELMNIMDRDHLHLSSGGSGRYDLVSHKSGGVGYLTMSQDGRSASGSASSITTESPSHRFMENSTNTQGDFAPKHGTHGEVQLIEQFEPGVYVTLIQLKDGTKVFKRVRFRYLSALQWNENILKFEFTPKFYCLLKLGYSYSKRRFAENQAEEWWKENQERVFKKYNHATQKPQGKNTSSHEEEPHS